MRDEARDKAIVQGAINREGQMVRARALWQSLFQELKELVRPDTTDFYNTMARPADSRRKIYDTTAPWSLDQLASGLHSYLTSPVDRWFDMGVAGIPRDQLPADAKLWLEQVTDVIYAEYTDPRSRFNMAMHEAYMDIGAFGTCVLYGWLDDATDSFRLRSFPLADVNCLESAEGKVDTVQRRIKYTVRQLEQEFGELPPKLAAKKRDDNVIEITHEVRPRTDRDIQSNLPKDKRWASIYFCKETGELLSEGGYNHMPYIMPRWTKLAGETYGRSPALSVLPAIRMINAMKKTIIQAAQKAVDPPIILEDDGYLLPFKTSPGSINYKRAGAEKIEGLPVTQHFDVAHEMMENEQSAIRSGFYVDWLVRPTKKERQTAQEITDDRNQMLSMMAPIVGRLQGEGLGPLVSLTYNLLADRRILSPAPVSLMRIAKKLEVSYISPAAKAQSMARGQGVQAYIQQVTQLQPLIPELMDSVNVDGLNAEMQDLTDVPRRCLNSAAQTAQKRATREKAQQAAQAAQMAPQVAGAAKDFATARATAPNPLGGGK